jgi:hypothetical protein
LEKASATYVVDQGWPTTEKQNMENKLDNALDALKELKALRLHSRANRSITTLEVQRKLVVKEYSERVKNIKAFILMIQQRESMGQLTLMGMDDIDISAALEKLIYDPTHGLMVHRTKDTP